MARLRKGVAYRAIERPYTRKSRVTQRSFIKGTPALKISRFVMGDLKASFQYSLQLKAKSQSQIRQEALESARKTVNRSLEKNIGKNYRFIIRKYPHHILRENPLATGAGADRLSTGMKLSFGKAIGIAAQVFRNDIVLEVLVNKQHLNIAKKALQKARYKLPIQFSIEVTAINQTHKL